MATVSAAMVKDLREKTGAGMMDCKNALNETSGDVEAAVDWLRKKGITKAAKKSGRVAAEGLVAVLVEGTKGVVVELNSETDFVARNADFQVAGPRRRSAVAFEERRRTSRPSWPTKSAEGRHGRGGGLQRHRPRSART